MTLDDLLDNAKQEEKTQEGAEAIEGVVEDAPDLNGPPLSIAIKTSVITQQPVGIIIKVGEVEHVTNVQNAELIALNILRVSGYLGALQSIHAQQVAQNTMATRGGLVGPNGSPVL